METSEGPDIHHKDNHGSRSLDKNQPSLSSLIIWNISKALEKDPDIDIRNAMRLANERMEHQSRDVNDLIYRDPEERYVACAVLAWQQLGHADTESLFEFIESHRNVVLHNASENLRQTKNICTVNSSDTSKRPKGFIDHRPSVDGNSVGSTSLDTYSVIGPVVKLPLETKVVMRVENTPQCARHSAKKSPKSDVKNKLDAACCLDSACMERLKDMEKATAELRARARRLARREAERAELLERAEAAWRDLELGYQRRLLLGEEKEEDLTKQIKKSIEDRNAYKQACTMLAQQFSKRGEIVEQDRSRLAQVEKEVCDLACARLRLSEESAKGDAAVADQQCKTVQLERDLQFKEEQARRKLLSIESVMDSSRGLTFEVERAMREELGAIREQITEVSTQLLEEDAESQRIKAELDDLRQQRTALFEDLEGCKEKCDNHMQGIADELNKKRQALKELKDKVIECECKVPLDAAVEVKRTPSLAALCRCTPEEHILHCCSCTSVRSTLLSNLLADLFSGLQAELGDTGSLMPCQLLKCLEDKHNWDRASVVKNNLRSFFSRLLVGELETAIATSIEKYHATWVGASCVDKAKMTPDPSEVENEGWQERLLERRAQQLAGQLAEELFQERADQLVEKAKEIVASGPPPCECQPQSNKTAAYSCLVKPPAIGGSGKKNDTSYPTYAKRTLQDVTLLRTQIEDLKKETIKKEDLRIMEEKITKLVQQAPGPESSSVIKKNTSTEYQITKQRSSHRPLNTENVREINGNKSSFSKKKTNNVNSLKKNLKKTIDLDGRVLDGKSAGKTNRRIEQSYAVNLCLYDGKSRPDSRLQNITSPDVCTWNENLPQSVLSQIPSNKHSKPIDKTYSKDLKSRKKSTKTPCLCRCSCFHKKPSNTSINKLLETLIKWKGDLLNSSIFNINDIPSIMSKNNYDNNIEEIHHDSELSNNKKSLNMSGIQGIKSQDVSLIESVNGTGTDQLPLLTTSEYIGEVNLDKSNENICKCGEKKELKHENNINNVNLLFNCLDTNKCSCGKYNDIKPSRTTKQNEESVKTKRKGFNDIAIADIEQLRDENNILEEKLRNAEACKNFNTSLTHQNDETSDNNVLSNDRDILVKFLGVTLTDTNVSKNEENCGKNNYRHSILKHKQQDFSSREATCIKSDLKEHSIDIEFVDDKAECVKQTNQCQFTEVCTKFDNKISEDIESVNKNDKRLNDILYETMSCVCCSYDDETKNLEVNTFTLLEKHLKHKLDEFRKSWSKSTDILPGEEEKVFVTILDKVKQVISNCTYSVKCECPMQSNKRGSWMRFNNLLEEYLKIKIKRVQCTCNPNEENLENILPGILEQVNQLIENDFERLKNLCQHENTNNLGYDKKNLENNRKQNIANNVNGRYLQPAIQCSDLEHVSNQVSRNFVIKDDFCDANQYRDTKSIQTSQNDLLLESQSVGVIINHCCNLRNRLPLHTSASKKETESKSQTILEESMGTSLNKLQDNNKDLNNTNSHPSLRVPYVGFTLSSSCDNLNSCFCSKTLSQSYIKNIRNIWEMLEINKKMDPNLSYIMHCKPQTVRSETNIINYIDVTDASNVPLILEPTSVKMTAASDSNEIILKNSHEKLKHSDINHNMTNTFDDYISVKTEYLNDDDVLYWYDCCPSPRSTKNNIIHKKAFYDSIYLPCGKLSKHGKSDTSLKNNVTMCMSRSKNCDCVMVPVCHVKMLVEDIESKLVNSQCTCDSLSAQVCPLHSKTLVD